MIQVLNSSWCTQNRKYINKQQHQQVILSNKHQQAAIDRSDSLLCAAISLSVLVLRTPASTAKQESSKHNQARIQQAGKHTSSTQQAHIRHHSVLGEIALRRRRRRLEEERRFRAVGAAASPYSPSLLLYCMV